MQVADKTYGRQARAEKIAEGAGQWYHIVTNDTAATQYYGIKGSKGELYYVNYRTCTCKDFEIHQEPCKHILAVRIHIKKVWAERKFAIGVSKKVAA